MRNYCQPYVPVYIPSRNCPSIEEVRMEKCIAKYYETMDQRYLNEYQHLKDKHYQEGADVLKVLLVLSLAIIVGVFCFFKFIDR